MTWWKQLLLEEDGSARPQIYCDMDGVLVDFASGAVRLMNDARDEVFANLQKYENLVPDNKNPMYTKYKFAKKIAAEIGWEADLTWEQIDKESNVDCRE